MSLSNSMKRELQYRSRTYETPCIDVLIEALTQPDAKFYQFLAKLLGHVLLLPAVSTFACRAQDFSPGLT
jgi:hypothetical protein